jgi:hypothetical protein
LFSSLSLIENSFAYPNFISYGYQSCLSCHYNPFGNGPLTDYGRAVGATAIADRIFWSKSASEEQIAKNSDFFMGKSEITEKKKWFRPSASYRGLYISRDFNKDSKQNDYITMDASVAAAMTFYDEKLIAVGQIGYAPTPITVKARGDELEEYRSREYYVGYRLEKEIGIYAGLMDKVYGIRVPDHRAYSRQLTANDQNDQTHGVLAHYSVDPIEFGVHAFIGNMVQDADLRQRGISAQFEYSTSTYTRVGASFISSRSDFKDVTAQAVHLRAGAGKGNSVMLEIGEVQTLAQGKDKVQGRYMFLQNHLNFRRGLYGLMTVEANQNNIENRDFTARFGPGVQWFPTYRVEVRTDLYNTKSYGTAAIQDTWTAMGQLHLWF